MITEIAPTKVRMDKDVSQFVSLVTQGINSWIEAGKIVAEAIAKDPSFIDRVCEQMPGLSRETVHRFEMIGLGRALPDVFLSDSPGMKRLRHLSTETQRKYCVEPVELLVVNGDETTTLKVDIRNLSASQSQQVFSRDGVRSVAAQKAWLIDKMKDTEADSIDGSLPYSVVRNRVIVRKPCTFSAGDLARLLAEIENR